MDLIESTHIATPNRLHHFGESITIDRRGQQVEVVVHEYIGMHRHLVLHSMLGQQFQEKCLIRRAGKDRLPVVAALQNVVEASRNRKPGETGHGKVGETDSVTSGSVCWRGIPARIQPAGFRGAGQNFAFSGR